MTAGGRSRRHAAVGAAAIGGYLALAAAYPADSVSVWSGGALPHAAWALATLALVVFGSPDSNRRLSTSAAGTIAAAWAVVVLVVVSTLRWRPVGGGAAGVAEAWYWIGAAAIVTAVVRFRTDLGQNGETDRRFRHGVAAVVLLGVGLNAVVAARQYVFDLPELRREYREDPDSMITRAGFDAPAGSTARMRFESRLFDGGPTGRFALANSLAGSLLMGWVLAVSAVTNLVTRMDRDEIRRRWLGWSAVAVGIAAMVVATSSRFAIVMLGVAVGTVALSARVRIKRERSVDGGGPLGIWLAALVATLLVALIDPTTMRLPFSVATRVHYWRSTWAMMASNPWTGVGPGDFQAVYERFRHPVMSEQIADPHHAVLQVGSTAGILAAVGWIGWVVGMLRLRYLTSRIAASALSGSILSGSILSGSAPSGSIPSGSIAGASEEKRSSLAALAADPWTATLIGATAVWGSSSLWASITLGDDAGWLLATAVVAAWAALRSPGGEPETWLDGRGINDAAVWAFAFGTTFLLFNGGVTVVGVFSVASVLAVGATAACSGVEAAGGGSVVLAGGQRRRRDWSLAAGVAASVGAVAAVFLWRAHVMSDLALSAGRIAAARGSHVAAERQFDRARRWTPDDVEPALLRVSVAIRRWRDEVTRRGLVPDDREGIERVFEDAERRGGRSPTVYAMLGREATMVAATATSVGASDQAARWYDRASGYARRAAELSPSHEGHWIELAAALHRTGDFRGRDDAIARARGLAGLTDNPERSLDRRRVLAVSATGRVQEVAAKRWMETLEGRTD